MEENNEACDKATCGCEELETIAEVLEVLKEQAVEDAQFIESIQSSPPPAAFEGRSETVIIKRETTKISPNPRRVNSMKAGYQFNQNVYPTTFESVPVGNNLPRNGLCPCGSGKKYKKCCKTAS